MKTEFVIGIIIIVLGIFCIVKPNWFAGKGHGVKEQQTNEIRRTGIAVTILGVLGLVLMTAVYYKS